MYAMIIPTGFSIIKKKKINQIEEGIVLARTEKVQGQDTIVDKRLRVEKV